MSRSLAVNSLYSLFSRGFNILFPLIISVYISRVFYADGLGKIMFAINIVTYFTLAASLGIPNYAIRIIAKTRDSRSLTSTSFSEIATIIFFSSLIATIAYYIFVFIIYRDDTESLKIALALGLMVLSNVTNYDWLFEAEEDFKYLAIRSILIKSIAIVLIIALVDSKEDIIVYALLFSSITVTNNCCNAISFRKYASFNLESLNVKQHIKPIFILFSAAIATDVYILLDSTMLGIMVEPESLGYYSNSSRIVRAIFGLLAAVTNVYNPRLNYIYSQNDTSLYKSQLQNYYNISMFIAVPSSFGLFVLAPSIISAFFGESFLPCITSLRILSGLIMIFSYAMVFGHVSLIIYHKEKSLFYATVIGAIFNFSLNLFLIPIFKHNGVALSSLFCEIIVSSVLVYESISFISIPLFNKNLLKSLVSSCIMLFILMAFQRFLANVYLQLFFAPLLGVISYLFVCLLLHHSICDNLKKTVTLYLLKINHGSNTINRNNVI